jgi:hypothetical protein
VSCYSAETAIAIEGLKALNEAREKLVGKPMDLPISR